MKEYKVNDLVNLIQEEGMVTYSAKENNDGSLTIECECILGFNGHRYSGHRIIRLKRIK